MHSNYSELVIEQPIRVRWTVVLERHFEAELTPGEDGELIAALAAEDLDALAQLEDEAEEYTDFVVNRTLD